MFSKQLPGLAGVGVGGEPEAEAELGVVLEQRIRPGRAATLRVRRPRGGRQVAAVDRRAARRVGDHQTVAEQLRQQFQIGRLAASRARAGEFEQRLEELSSAHGAEVHAGPLGERQCLEERDVVTARLHYRFAGTEVDCFGERSTRGDRRAGLDAQPAAGAVLRVHLQRVAGVRQTDSAQRHGRERCGCAAESVLLVELGADHAVRADESAVAALDAGVGVPYRDELGDVAFFVGRGTAGVGAVDRQRTDRQRVAASGDHLGGDGAHELRGGGRHRRAGFVGGGDPVGDLDLMQPVDRVVDRREFALHDVGAVLGVGLGDGLLDPGDRLIAGEHVGDREEAGLQHDVDAAGEPDVPGDPAGVDRIHPDAFVDDLLLHRAGQ